MIKVFQFKDNTEGYKKFLFPKDDSFDCSDGIEVVSDLDKKEFFVRKVNFKECKEDKSWVPYNDNTFPSSLFREFLNLL